MSDGLTDRRSQPDEPPKPTEEQKSEGVNPKDLLGMNKVPLDLIPPVASIHAALAHYDGASKYGPFNWRQYPRWMNGYTEEDHDAILQEMQDVIDAEGTVYIPEDEAWREMVLGAWEAIGGDRFDLLKLLAEADRLREERESEESL